MDKYDKNSDGPITPDEIDRQRAIIEIELGEEKARTQKRMAWVALYGILGVTCYLFTPYISDSRVAAIADLLGLFYISLAGIVAAYFGVQAWVATHKKETTRSKYDYLKYDRGDD
jgi:cytochrome bd-type quinol oxidase subunit 2